MNRAYLQDHIDTPAGKVNRISTKWTATDLWQTIKVRWSIGRMNYKVKQNIYAVGHPDENSDVFVTANFKLSFDILRRALDELNAWVLVLDTKGINVWCAAGKGTFGTKELVYRIKAHGLDKIVNHRHIIVPQLGAVGVSAHEVKEKTGFRVIYGPVQANDIKTFLENNKKASPEMRKVKFPFVERIKLIPVELFYGGYFLLLIPAIFFILSGLSTNGYSVKKAWESGGMAVLYLFSAYISGCIITPALLPLIPFRMFSLKGLIIGWLMAGLFVFAGILSTSLFETLIWFLIMGSISSFLAMNFTGASTFTSLSGVTKEMKLALPLQIGAAIIGIIGWIITRFI